VTAIVFYRCTQCGYVSLSLGWLHGHIERHRGYTRFNIQLPFTRTSPGDFEALMERTEVLVVADARRIDVDEVGDTERRRYPSP
jgi:hypothetical protein